MTDSQKHLIFRLGLLVLVIVAVYGSSLTHGFVWDDNFIIVNNPLLEKQSNIPRFFLSEDTIEESTGYYRPMTYISFALERAVWGVNPFGYHLTNLILHIVTVLLFYRIIGALFNKERQAFVAALLFALHPVAGETVNFLAGGRNTLLSACFALLSLLFYINKKHLPALLSFTVAIFSKEFALLMPVIFLLYDYRLRREKIRYGNYALYLIPTAIYLTLRSYAVQKANFLSAINFSDVATAPYLVVRFAWNMLLPLQLKVLYDVNFTTHAELLSLVAIVALLFALYVFRKHSEILFSSIWFLLFLLPVINIIPLRTTTVMADRYAYFSLMGAALFLAALLCIRKTKTATAAVVVLCLAYSAIDINTTGAWKNDIEFFTRMTQDAPDNFTGFKNLGEAYYLKGDINRAVLNFDVADAKPGISEKYLIGNAYILWKENRLEMAEKSLLRVIKDNPLNPEPYFLLMMIYEQQGNVIQAGSYRNKIGKMNLKEEQIIKEMVVDLCRIGETLISKRQFTYAEMYFWHVLRINPAFVPALVDMGNIRAEQGKTAEAVAYLNKALASDPANASAHYNLSALYKMQGKLAEAQAEMIKFQEADAASKQKMSGSGR